MDKINQYTFRMCVYTVCISALVYSPISISGCECDFCSNSPIEIDYNGLEEYEEMFREFEHLADQEDAINSPEASWLKKWCKKSKRWFKKRVASVLKSLINYKKFKSGEHCAYEIAHFKRNVDKKLYDTGDIEDVLNEFDNSIDDAAFMGMQSFKERVRFYYHNKNAKPTDQKTTLCFDCSRPGQHKGQLDDIPLRALIGGVEVAVGSMIQVLPYAGCFWLGRALIGHGMTQIYEGYMQQNERSLLHG